MHTRVLDHLDLPAPSQVAHGCLLQTAWRWPQLITTRLEDQAWAQRELSHQAQMKVAAQRGRAMRRVHDVTCPMSPYGSKWRFDELLAPNVIVVIHR
jgi:hypothetical protein